MRGQSRRFFAHGTGELKLIPFKAVILLDAFKDASCLSFDCAMRY
jgi:hypothetical protein